MNRTLALLTVCAATAACDSDPVDAAGEYSISVTNRENGCDFDDWTEGNTATGIPVTITQDDEDATATIEGVTGFLLDVVLGPTAEPTGPDFTGSVDGNHLELTRFGTRNSIEGNCSFTINAVIDAELDGDILQGVIRYETNTNDSPDCGAKEECASIQEFNGTRPPS
jgi:hypothetical protein